MSTNTHPTQPTNTQPSAAAPAAQPVDEPLKNWAFPFTPLDSKLDASDPMTYMKALASAEDGFFPLGASGMLHGGIHFDQNTAKLLNQDEGVRAIADGEVVAYRLDSAYPEQVYRDGRHAYYSTSFVLIRHKLALPPLPTRAAASTSQGQTAAQPASGSQGASAPQAASSAQPGSTPAAQPPKQAAPDETLTFFSLYMHLTDYATYQAAQTKEGVTGIDTKKLNLASMPYWQGDRYYRVGDKAQDKQAVPKRQKPTPAPSPAYDPLGAFIEDNYTVPPSPVDDEPPPPPPVVGLRICITPNGKMIGVLPKGAELIASDNETHPGWVKIKSLKSGQPVAAMVGKTVDAHAPWSWVPLAGLDLVVDPQPRDTVVVLKNPYPVKAGDIVGEPGHYLRYTDAKVIKGATVRSLAHLEVFAGQELKAFIDKSRQRATEARNAEHQAKDGRDLPGAKTLMEVSPGALLVTSIPECDQKVQPPAGGLKLAPVAPARGCRWILVQPQEKKTSGGHHPHVTFKNVGTKIWVDAKLANTTTADLILGWTNFPLSLSKVKGPGADFREVFRRTDLDKLGADNIALDENGTRWWNITLASKDGSQRQGWVCEKDHPLARMCGPWDWPGFELVDNTGFKPVEMLKRYLYATDQYLPGESKSDFEPSALAVNAGELIVKLENAVDSNHDGKVTAQELRHAQETPWIAEAVSHLIVRSETEWGGGLGKWEEVSPLMKKLLWLWQAEIDRIGKLQWWEKAASIQAFPKDAKPWHLHPIALVGNFTTCTSHPVITIKGEPVELQFLLKSNGVPINDQDYASAAAELGCEPRAIKAVAKTETGSSGPYFRPGQDLASEDDPVPAILFERHLFHRETQGRYDQSHPRISDPTQGGYGLKKIQYEKLMEAYELDPEAALRSASWGRFQILGSNSSAAGFESVNDYVEAVSESEANQLRAFTSFIKSDPVLHSAIVSKNWHAFAIRYNGKKQNGYDTRIAANYNELG
ncbi:hypothetical protein F4827_007003 [Paraburkholderia bannensis]|uniref:N-acetylmuramidase domain-containing protein n=1 Tax=Paraburkholderia bannensis TaxID=765414 RepID=A0A7W9U501_9BURK|nr:MULTISPECIES: N-acetylmuramidase family protein [Paraburkholderia]MBB3262123.1 hypothetical protein [Paraburkholderia sp. WP4_3_2]MBB6107122.1 hypothetical protein [Paraburkholderia bannensis]